MQTAFVQLFLPDPFPAQLAEFKGGSLQFFADFEFDLSVALADEKSVSLFQLIAGCS